MGDNKFKWYMGAGREPESCHGPFDSRAEAIAEGRGYDYAIGFTVLEADKAVPSLPDADALMEAFLEDNEELADPDGDCFDCKTTIEQENELTNLIRPIFKDWMDRHKLWPHVWTFGTQRNQEYFAHAEAV